MTDKKPNNLKEAFDILRDIPMSEIPETTADDFIVTTKPTANDVVRAERDLKLIIVVVVVPDFIVDNPESVKIWANGVMYGWGLPPSSWIACYAVREGVDPEKTGREIVEYFVSTPVTKGIGKTTIGVPSFNIVDSSVKDIIEKQIEMKGYL